MVVSLLGCLPIHTQATEDFAPLVQSAWAAVRDSYYSPSFDAQAWESLQSRIGARVYATREDAHAGIRSLLTHLGDPAVRFLTEEQTAHFMTEVSGAAHSGVGLAELLSIDTHELTGRITIITPIPNSPAARAGLLPGDVITSIDGVATGGMSLADCAARLRGKAGTEVSLEIGRGDEVFSSTLRREQIRLPAPVVQSRLVEIAGKKIGHVLVYQFTASAGREARLGIEQLLRQGASAFVLDLRNNPGGALQPTLDTAAIFLGTRPIAQLSTRVGNSDITARGELVTDKPLAVLVNEGSASAAEVLASALQSHRRATLVGVQTFGKGLVHGLAPLSDGSALLITRAHVKTLEGRPILSEGVKPDVLVRVEHSPILGLAPIAPASANDVQFQEAAALLISSL
jgi:carboxyl-terminal processing protease